MRERLRRSARPNRLFEASLDVARAAGLVGRKRVLDSTPLYDAVATQDTVTLIRSAIRALLRNCDGELRAKLRGCLKRDDVYVAPGKPTCDWDDAEARETLVDALARDAHSLLLQLDGKKIGPELMQATSLLATVVGQDLEQLEGTFRIARRVAVDRVISIVDPETRHGHKTAARGFDGYKGHVAIDPDSEIITATEVTPGNTADGAAAEALLTDVLPSAESKEPPVEPTAKEAGGPSEPEVQTAAPFEVFGDGAYGTADLVEKMEAAGVVANVKVQAPAAIEGRFSKDAFHVDLEAQTVKCPADKFARIRTLPAGGGIASFGVVCSSCPLRDRCTNNKEGRTIRIHPKESTLQRSRQRQRDPAWKAHYRETRPKVERKLAHLMFRRHGGRRSRMRGTHRIRQDFALLGAAHNLKRLASLGVRHVPTGWIR